VLKELYAATGGDLWKRKTCWISAAPLSEWQGVTIDTNERVTRLQVFDNKLSGINSSLALRSNDYMSAGNIPAELSQLSSLEWLLLNNNNLTGKSYTLTISAYSNKTEPTYYIVMMT